MRKIIFREAASTEMGRISRYTKKTWGLEQSRKYAVQLRERIKSLREFPLRYPEVEQRPGIRQMRCGQHIVFYSLSENTIEIINVVHAAADLDKSLG